MFDWMTEFLDKLGKAFVQLLPLSPFTSIINSLESMPYLSYINWFIPFGTLVKISAGWLVAIGLHYAYSVVMRWVKMIS